MYMFTEELLKPEKVINMTINRQLITKGCIKLLNQSECWWLFDYIKYICGIYLPPFHAKVKKLLWKSKKVIFFFYYTHYYNTGAELEKFLQ